MKKILVIGTALLAFLTLVFAVSAAYTFHPGYYHHGYVLKAQIENYEGTTEELVAVLEDSCLNFVPHDMDRIQRFCRWRYGHNCIKFWNQELSNGDNKFWCYTRGKAYWTVVYDEDTNTATPKTLGYFDRYGTQFPDLKKGARVMHYPEING